MCSRHLEFKFFIPNTNTTEIRQFHLVTSFTSRQILRSNCHNFCLQKLWYQHVWPSLQQEMRTQEVLAAVLQPVLYLIQESTIEEYESLILPSFRCETNTSSTFLNIHLIINETYNTMCFFIETYLQHQNQCRQR